MDVVTPKTPAVVGNNWNPFSSKPSMDAPSFAVSLLALSALIFGLGFLIQEPIHSARLTLDYRQLGVFYGAWILLSIIGFLMVTNTFIKRWATIWGYETESPRWMRTVGRLFLTSPLLSIWATVFTVTYSKAGGVFREDEKRGVIAATALGTLLLFHVCFLGYRMVRSEIRMSHGYFVLVNEQLPRDSLRAVVPSFREEFWLPGPAFQIHVYPYFSPVSKLAVSLYGDFIRARTLSSAIEEKPDAYCDSVPTYVGQAVPNCFLTRYRELGRHRAFVSPATGVIYETVYRKSVAALAATSPIDAFAKSAISVENLVALLEPGELVYDRQQFLHPSGFLAFFGSPELPAIAIGQDAQHLALSQRLIPMIEPQLEKLEKGLAGMKGALSPSDESAARGAMTSMTSRMHDLSRDPLALHGRGE